MNSMFIPMTQPDVAAFLANVIATVTAQADAPEQKVFRLPVTFVQADVIDLPYEDEAFMDGWKAAIAADLADGVESRTIGPKETTWVSTHYRVHWAASPLPTDLLAWRTLVQACRARGLEPTFHKGDELSPSAKIKLSRSTAEEQALAA